MFTAAPSWADQLRVAAYRDLLGMLSDVVALSHEVSRARQAVAAIDGLGEPNWLSDDSVNEALLVLRAAEAKRELGEASLPLDMIGSDVQSALGGRSAHPLVPVLLQQSTPGTVTNTRGCVVTSFV